VEGPIRAGCVTGCPEFVWRSGGEALIRRWNEFVTNLETDYCPNCVLEEYRNDLDTRELIHDIGYDAEVRESDETFAAVLTATNSKHRIGLSLHASRENVRRNNNCGYKANGSSRLELASALGLAVNGPAGLRVAARQSRLMCRSSGMICGGQVRGRQGDSCLEDSPRANRSRGFAAS